MLVDLQLLLTNKVMTNLQEKFCNGVKTCETVKVSPQKFCHMQYKGFTAYYMIITLDQLLWTNVSVLSYSFSCNFTTVDGTWEGNKLMFSCIMVVLAVYLKTWILSLQMISLIFLLVSYSTIIWTVNFLIPLSHSTIAESKLIKLLMPLQATLLKLEPYTVFIWIKACEAGM